jgi:hypothetical protein
MGRWITVGIALLATAAIFAACGDEEDGGPTATPERTAASTVIATAQATAAAGRSNGIPTVPAPVVTQHPPSPTAQPPAPTPEPTQAARQPEWTVSQVQGATQVQVVLEDGLGNAYTVASVDPDIVQWENWGVQFAADLNADGVQDVLVYHFTGGAHCCFEY